MACGSTDVAEILESIKKANMKEEEYFVQVPESSKGIASIEEEEDLFEIDLEAVNSIPPPYYWDSYVTATGNALLANCLLPISDLSSAVPMVSKACNALPIAGTGKVLMVMERVPLGKLLGLGLPFLGAFGVQHKEMEA